MPNAGNGGAAQFVEALRLAVQGKNSPERVADFGTINSDYGLVMDSFPVAIPRGEWSMIRQPTAGTDAGLKPGDRVMAAWVGNEAVVIGIVTRM